MVLHAIDPSLLNRDPLITEVGTHYKSAAILILAAIARRTSLPVAYLIAQFAARFLLICACFVLAKSFTGSRSAAIIAAFLFTGFGYYSLGSYLGGVPLVEEKVLPRVLGLPFALLSLAATIEQQILAGFIVVDSYNPFPPRYRAGRDGIVYSVHADELSRDPMAAVRYLAAGSLCNHSCNVSLDQPARGNHVADGPAMARNRRAHQCPLPPRQQGHCLASVPGSVLHSGGGPACRPSPSGDASLSQDVTGMRSGDRPPLVWRRPAWSALAYQRVSRAGNLCHSSFVGDNDCFADRSSLVDEPIRRTIAGRCAGGCVHVSRREPACC